MNMKVMQKKNWKIIKIHSFHVDKHYVYNLFIFRRESFSLACLLGGSLNKLNSAI